MQVLRIASGGTFTGDVAFDEAISIERVKDSKVNIFGSPTSGVMTVPVKNGAVLYNTVAVTGNYEIQLGQGDGTTTLSIMSTNQVLTVANLVTYGSTTTLLVLLLMELAQV